MVGIKYRRRTVEVSSGREDLKGSASSCKACSTLLKTMKSTSCRHIPCPPHCPHLGTAEVFPLLLVGVLDGAVVD